MDFFNTIMCFWYVLRATEEVLGHTFFVDEIFVKKFTFRGGGCNANSEKVYI